MSHTESASCPTTVLRSNTRSAPGTATASCSLSTRPDPGSYGIRRPAPNHSAAVTRIKRGASGPAVWSMSIAILLCAI